MAWNREWSMRSIYSTFIIHVYHNFSLSTLKISQHFKIYLFFFFIIARWVFLPSNSTLLGNDMKMAHNLSIYLCPQSIFFFSFLSFPVFLPYFESLLKFWVFIDNLGRKTFFENRSSTASFDFMLTWNVQSNVSLYLF